MSFKLTSSQLADVAERVVWTFIQTFTALLLAGNIFDITAIQTAAQAAAAAAIAAGLSLIKSIAATQLGLGSASTLPVTYEPEPNGVPPLD